MFWHTPETDPWSEDPEQLAGLAIASLANLSTLIENNRKTLPRAVTALSTETKGVISALQADDALYCSHRRLFVQEIPAFVGLINALINTRANSDGSAEVTKVIAELTKNVAIATEHLRSEFVAISRQKVLAEVDEARRGWNVLPGLSRSLTEVAAETGKNPLGAFKKLGTSTTTAIANVTSDATSFISSITDESAARVNAAGKLARIAGTATLTTLKEHTIDRTLLYSTAAIKTVWAAGGLAMIVGLVTVVIFAPAAPFAAGLMAFTAPSTFAEILKADMSEAERKRALRQRGASEELIEAWTALKGQRLIRVDTPHLTVEMDVIDKKIDGTVLTGRYAGQRLSQLSTVTVELLTRHAPDTETGKLLEEYLNRQQAKVVAVRSPKDSRSEEKSRGFDFDGLILLGGVLG